MGSYAQLYLDSFELGTTKNYIDPDIMWLFRHADKLVQRADHTNRQRLSRYISSEYIDEYDPSNPLPIVQYSCTAAAAADRLDLLGFTLDAAAVSFQNGLKAELASMEHSCNIGAPASLVSHYRDEQQLLKNVVFDDWMEALSRIIKCRLDRETIDELPLEDPQKSLLQHMVRDWRGLYGFPAGNWLLFVRAVVETASEHAELVYDLTDLAGGGWIEETEDLVANADHLASHDSLLHRRTIVLTEGKSDRRILEQAMRLLYPHLAEYFHFFDFDAQKSEGGVGQLAKLVRAFAAAGIQERTVALFDNDTAATEALQGLRSTTLPKNLVVLRLPDLSLADSYPTLGPSGIQDMNVNGLAGSIELYLGEDVLRGDDGTYLPIQWTGLIEPMGRYQGSFSKENKGRIQRRFEDKLADCEADPDRILMYDWEGLHAIIGVLRTAFHAVNLPDTE